MKVGDKFTYEIEPGIYAEITIMSMDERGYSYNTVFPDGHIESGNKRWADQDALPISLIHFPQREIDLH